MGKYGFSVYLGGISDRVRTGDVEDFLKGYGKILDIALKNKYGFIEFEDKYDAEDACKDLDDTKMCGERVRLEMSKGCKDKYRDFQRTGRVRYRSFSREASPSRGRFRSKSPGGERGGSGGGERGGRGGERGGGRGGGRSRSRSRGRGGGSSGGRGGGRDRDDGGRRTFYDKPAYKKYGAPTKSKWSVEVDNLSSRCSWQDLKDFMRKAGEVCYGAAHGDVGKNKGVVCYDRKEDAQRAIEELEGRDINGRAIELKYVVREDWDAGAETKRSRSRSRSPPPRRSRTRSRSRSPARKSRASASKSRSRSRSVKKQSRSRSRSRSRSAENKRRGSRSRSRS